MERTLDLEHCLKLLSIVNLTVPNGESHGCFQCFTFIPDASSTSCRILEVSPSLINLPHPSGWFPIHAVILCGDPSFVEFVLRLPGVDLSKKDTSSFTDNSSKDGLLRRQKELCPDLAGTFNTHGATALHFACMRADFEILDLILEMPVDHHIKDNASRTPRDYFDYERVDIEVLQRYEEALGTWHRRWRSRVKKGTSDTVRYSSIK